MSLPVREKIAGHSVTQGGLCLEAHCQKVSAEPVFSVILYQVLKSVLRTKSSCSLPSLARKMLAALSTSSNPKGLGSVIMVSTYVSLFVSPFLTLSNHLQWGSKECSLLFQGTLQQQLYHR